MASASSLSDRAVRDSSASDENVHCEEHNLVYRFDPNTPWVYFRGGAPVASSVEIGRRKISPKLKKVYVKKQSKICARKNRSHKDMRRMSLLCSCDQGCLVRRPPAHCRQMIYRLRQNFHQKSYNEQNYILSKQMEVSVCPSGKKRVIYKVPSLGTVCRGAFMKCYGFSHWKVRILLKKLDVDGVSIQPDMRGRHHNRPRKLLPEARKAVIEFISSHNASESHYRRARTKKRFFDCRVSMRKMWRDFVSQNPHFKTNRSNVENKGPVISFSTFRNIFNEDLREEFGFRKARIDTCQFCDETENKINIISTEIEQGDVSRTGELENLQKELNGHWKESEIRFAALKYDMEVLSKKQ